MFADAEPLSREPEGERAVTPEQQPAPPLSLHLSTYQASGLQCWWGAEGTGLQSFDSYLAPSVVVDEYWCFAIQNLNQKTIARFSYLFLDEHNLIFWSIWSFNCTVCMCVCVCVSLQLPQDLSASLVSCWRTNVGLNNCSVLMLLVDIKTGLVSSPERPLNPPQCKYEVMLDQISCNSEKFLWVVLCELRVMTSLCFWPTGLWRLWFMNESVLKHSTVSCVLTDLPGFINTGPAVCSVILLTDYNEYRDVTVECIPPQDPTVPFNSIHPGSVSHLLLCSIHNHRTRV